MIIFQFINNLELKNSGIYQFTILISAFLSLFFIFSNFAIIIINLAIKNFLPKASIYTTQVNLILDSLIIITGYLFFYYYLNKKFNSGNQPQDSKLTINIKETIIYYFIIFGIIIYMIHLLLYYSNSLEPITGILYSSTFSFSYHLLSITLLLLLYYGVAIPIGEEFLYRKFMVNFFLEKKFGIFLVSLLISLIYIVPTLILLLTVNQTLQIFDYIIIKFILAFILCFIYYLTRKIIYTLLLNISVSSYVFFHQLAFSNLQNQLLEFVFTLVKMSLIYLAFIFLVFLALLYYFNKYAFPKVSMQNMLTFNQTFFKSKTLLIGLIVLFLFPLGLDYYLTNIFVFNPKIDSNFLFIGKSIILLIILFILVKYYFNLSILKTCAESDIELKNVLDETKDCFQKFLLILKSFKETSRKRKFGLAIKNVIKLIVAISFFFPLIILNISGLVKLTIFSIFQLTTRVSLSFNEHILYSLFDVKTSIGFSAGTNGIVFLRNINGKYFFLPTSYYADPFDWVYGLMGSILWCFSLIYFFKVIWAIMSNEESSFQKFKTIIIYFLLLIIWNIFNFGLFQPSSFLLGKKPVSQQNQSLLNNLSIVHVQFFFLPFGFLLILFCLLFYLSNSIITKIKSKDKEFNEQLIA